MKKTILITTLLLSAMTFAQSPCDNGDAAGFPCNNYDLMSTLTLTEMDASSGNDSWGWTDSDTGKEYALMGLDNGTAFVDISDPTNLVYLGKLPTHTQPDTWRDIKVFNNHAFIVSEASNHGMQVFDLTRLRTVTNPPVTFDEDAHYDNFGSAHNVAINEDTGFAYAIGTVTFDGGGHYVDINNPTNPVSAGGSSTGGYTHDAQIVIYNGPDTDHTGKEIYFGSNEDEVVIIDVSNKSNPQLISSVSYTNEAYTHQGWLTEDQSFFIVNDEADEATFGFNTRTIVFDVTNLDNPFFKFDYSGPTPATDHNLYIKDNKAYLANYSEGLRVIDVSDIENENFTEIGSFDTFPENNIAGTDNGIWSVYPFFDSGNILLSDYNRGLFIVKESNTLTTDNFNIEDFSITPNPAKNKITISSKEDTIQTIEMFNVLGQRIKTLSFTPTSSKVINIDDLSAGMYLIKINQNTITRLIKD